MLRPLTIIAAAFLAACASAPPRYAPAATPGAAGYSERQIESNRFFVSFRAANPADPARLQDYALLRAAELTLAHGRDWFWVDRRSFEEGLTQTRAGPSIGVGVGGGSWGGRSGASVGVGVNLPLGGAGGARAREATLEIRFGHGAKPDDPNAYDARATSANIRARLMQ